MPENGVTPNLPCPGCGANILTEGFYNSCTETQRLREDNNSFIAKEHLYIDHDAYNFETVNHQCDLEAFCKACDKLLPWPLFVIRGLDGIPLSQVGVAIAMLISQHGSKTPGADA